MVYFYIFILGTSIGSFINVIIYRLPKRISIVYPRSKCPNCNYKIKWFDNIPLLSWLILRGKCRQCKLRINSKYFFIELLTGLLFIIVLISPINFYLELPFVVYLLISAIFLTTLIIQFLFDIKYLYLPSSVTYFGSLSAVLINLLYGFYYENSLFFSNLLGSITGVTIFTIIYLLGNFLYKKEVLGLGDIKLIGMVGLWIGLKGILLTIYLSFLSAGILCLFLLLLKKIKKGSIIPFGPFIIISSLLVWITGSQKLIEIYKFSINFLI